MIEISELYCAAQGEGEHMGRLSLFVRVHRCNLQCDWCWEAGTRVFSRRPAISTRGKPVHTHPKKLPIEEVVVGDEVMGRDPAGGMAWTKVEQVFERVAPALIYIRFASGRAIRVTPEHRLHVGGKWVPAAQLRLGDEVTHIPKLFTRGQRKQHIEHRVRVSAAKKNHHTPFGDPVDSLRARKSSAGRRSRREHYFVKAYQQAKLPVKFVGDGSLWIGRRNPDFVIEGQKKVIEVQRRGSKGRLGRTRLGGTRRGHSIEQRVQEMVVAGYQVLVIDEDREARETVPEVWDFIHNGDAVQTLIWLEGRFPVYDLQCSPHHNYFGEGYLGHNCDTKFSWDKTDPGYADYKIYEPRSLVSAMLQTASEAPVYPDALVLTGGEPLIYQRELPELIDLYRRCSEELHGIGSIAVEVETAGTITPHGDLARRVHFNVSHKLPNSENVAPVSRLWNLDALEVFLDARAVFKPVVGAPGADVGDEELAVVFYLSWLRKAAEQCGYRWESIRKRVYLMPCGVTRAELGYSQQIAIDFAAKFGVRCTTRMQIIAWGKERRR